MPPKPPPITTACWAIVGEIFLLRRYWCKRARSTDHHRDHLHRRGDAAGLSARHRWGLHLGRSGICDQQRNPSRPTWTAVDLDDTEFDPAVVSAGAHNVLDRISPVGATPAGLSPGE